MWARVAAVAVSGAVWMGSIPAALSALPEQLPVGLPDFPRRVRRELPQLRPDQHIHFGILDLHPSFESGVTYDDNIRLAHIDPADDVIFSERPAIVGEVKFGNHRVEAGYGTELLTYVKVQEENTTNHLAHGILELNFNDLHLTASDTMEKSTSRIFSETSARDHVLFNTIQVLGRYDRPHWASENAWTHNTVDHRTTQFKVNNYGEDVFSVLGGYKVLPKTLALVEADAGIVNYAHNTSNADQTYWQIMTGVRGELGPKISTTVKIGFQGRQLSDVGGQGPHENYEGVVADMDLTYEPTKQDTLRAGYVRTVVPSTFGANNWYRQDRIAVSYRRQLTHKWSVTPHGGWQLNAYPELSTVAESTKHRRDNFALAGASVRYQVQEWLWATASYDFRGRSSNLDALAYDNNRVAVDVTIAF